MSRFLAIRDGGKTDEEGAQRLLAKLFPISEAVLDASHLAVSEKGAGANLSVDIAVGDAIITEGTYLYHVWSTAVENLVITTPDPSNPRIDAVVGYVDRTILQTVTSNNPDAFVLLVVAGTPAGSPVAPTDGAIDTAVGAGNPWIKLAEVAVAAGAGQILNANITDKRSVLFGVGIVDNVLNLRGTNPNIKVGGVNAKKTVVLKPGFLKPTTTAGCAASAQSETTTNKINFDTLDFDPTTEQHAFAKFTLPDSWDGGKIKFKVKWTAVSGSGGVVWGLAGRSFGNDDLLDQALGTEVQVTDTLLTAKGEHVSPESADVTLAGTPVGGEEIYVEIARKAANASDTLAVNAQLKSLIIEFGLAKYSD